MESKKGHKAVFGIFKTRESLERAVNALKGRGFRNSDISVLLPSQESNPGFAHEKATKAPEGVAAGATSAAVLGGALGWLVGLGSLAIPGIGPFVAAGPLVSALAGAGMGGAVGGVAGALIGFGIPEYEAKRYESFVKEGGYLLSIHVDDSDWQKKARDILEEYGAQGVDAAGEKKSTPPPSSRPIRM